MVPENQRGQFSRGDVAGRIFGFDIKVNNGRDLFLLCEASALFQQAVTQHSHSPPKLVNDGYLGFSSEGLNLTQKGCMETGFVLLQLYTVVTIVPDYNALYKNIIKII